MLQELQIQNLATIEKLAVTFSPGLNIFTGETGAGKSVIIDALGLVLGGRADTDLIRTGESAATIEAVFQIADAQTKTLLEELGFAEDKGTIVIKRILSTGDKSRAFLNDGNITVSALAKIGNRLVDIHGQHDHQTLLYPECHIDLLDRYAKCLPLRQEFNAVYSRHQAETRELTQAEQQERDRAQREDLLRFQMNEIESAHLESDEEDRLKGERNKLRHAEKLAQILGDAHSALSESEGSVEEKMGNLHRQLRPLPEIDPALAKTVERAETLFYEVRDLAGELGDYLKGLQFKPERLEEIEDRLAEIQTLKRKYGQDIPAILAHREKITVELDTLAANQERIEALRLAIRQTEKEVAKRAVALADKREKGAEELKKNIEKELRDLSMKHVRFGVRFDYEADPAGFIEYGGKIVRLGAAGLGNAEFLFSPNPGEDLRPLAKIASGGELSRVMLAIKTILNEQDTIPTLIFDEVDAGIGGKVAETIGAKLKKLAEAKQVFCITHLPQIAGMANAHYRVEKSVSGKRTQTRIVKLDYDMRVEEIARMSGGEKITQATLNHAKEMIK